ncbi:uncharacterized protein [Parasteatoda tepidariorum]|uniref:uncharacterized protein n=1 Tax=Parasteatoda tepidariorum TaxID=114398 RepID=UPI001C7233F6|nr:uncharacterized protein LOC122269826 [Parasteatoda tepidariorum]
MDKINKLIEKRSSVRSGITKLIKRINLEEQAETDTPLEELLELLETKEQILKKHDSDIEDLITDPEKFKTEIKVSEEYDEKIISTKIKLKSKIKEMNKEINHVAELSHNTSTETVEHTFSALKLPKLEIPRFSGDSNFTEFLNCFNSAIGTNDSLSKIEKFQYLKSLLSPPAYNVVAGFELNDKNYDSCIELLKQRYGRTDFIINSYMTKLLNLEPVRNSSYVKGLRKLYDEIEVNIRNLRALNVTEGSYGHLLNPLLLKLLPQELVLEFHRKRDKNKNCEVSEIMTFLRNEVESREICESVMSSPKNYESKRTPFQNYQSGQTYQKNYSKPKNVATASTLHTQSKNICIFCGLVNSHDSVDCKKLDVETKIGKLMSDGRCWVCFKRNHYSKLCRSGIVCKICNSKYHHESVCRKTLKPQNYVNRANETKTKDSENDTNSNKYQSNSKINVENISVSHNNIFCKDKAFLQTCSVLACSDKNSILANAILDNASHRNFISSKLTKELKLKPVRYEKLAIYSFGQTKACEKEYPVISLKLINKSNSSKWIEIECLVTHFISNLTLNKPDALLMNELKTKGYELADSFHTTNCDLLIGSGIFWRIVYNERMKLNEDVSLINSHFGWLLSGYNKLGHDSAESCENVCLTMDSTSILFDLKLFWEIEEFPNEKICLSEKDNLLIKNFEDSLRFNGERYVCKLMWKDNLGPPLEMDSNYEVAKRRFDSLENKLNKNPEILDQYKQIVSEQIKCNIVGNSVNENLNSGYFMPHRAVIRNDKETSRVRIVYDCSSKANDNKKSLNDSLESGINLYPNLLDIILKFRENQVAFCGDLEKAYHMIEIAEEDRNYLKFLWFSDETDNSKRILQFNRLPFGLTTSSFVLACVLKFHIRKFKVDQPNCYEMLNSLYVDDLYYGAKTIQDAYQLSSSAIEILRAAGFNLRKLKTNCMELNELWRKNGYEENTDFGQGAGFLGLKWDPIEDKIKLDLKELRFSLESGTTKRQVLRIISKIFDPCGFISPFVVRAKIIMQEIWERGLKWDEDLPSDLVKKWKKWCSEIADLDNYVIIERKLCSTADISDVSLHIFVDASPKAYGAVAYLRYTPIEGHIEVKFIISKCKVAPLKTLTLARLELMAALVGARLGKYLRNVFPNFTQQIYYWSDSKIVLHWIKGSSKLWKPFVSNRVAEVQTLTLPECWNHCSGVENPADFITRGESAVKIVSSSLWWSGPVWLSHPVNLWPAVEFCNQPDASDVVKKEQRAVVVNALTQNKTFDISLTKFIDINKYSYLTRLLRVTAWVKRFAHNAKPNSSKLKGPISAFELQNALHSWIKTVKLLHYESEIQQLLSQNTLSKHSRIFNLNCKLNDDNLLFLQGRLQFSSDDVKTKHPVLLPSNDKFVELVILDAHVKIGHLGVDSTLTHLREQYWIIKGKQFVKKVLRNCLICRRYKVKPGTQVVAPLPPDRIKEQPPFDISGVDFAGPFFVTDSNNKCYLLIFTCAVTRAVHLELVINMNTDSFLLGFRRFISRRGLCSILYSDNAKAFKKANNELKKWWNQINDPQVKNMFASKNIVWKFIVEKSPWWGGFWERQIRTVKTCLKKIIGKSSLTLKELETVFLEIEAMINSRPITYLYNEPSEPSPLTPSHFLVGKRLMSLPVVKYKPNDLIVNRDSLTKRYKYQQTLLDHFWNRWRKQYLLHLRSAYISSPPGKITSFKVNYIVLINDERYPRNMWMLGRILEVYQGRDGNIRSLLIKTPKGDIRRSVQLVSNLEINP